MALTLVQFLNNAWQAIAVSSTDTTNNVVSGKTSSFSIYGITLNLPPIADPGEDRTVLVGEIVQLDGSGSSDPDGNALSFLGKITSRSDSSSSLISSPDSIQPTFSADLPGTYIVELVVNDGKLDSSPKTVTISTNSIAPDANAGVDKAIVSGTLVQLDGSAASLSNVQAEKPSFTADLARSYVVKLIVNDAHVDSEPDYVFIVADLGTFSKQHFSLGVQVFMSGMAAGDLNGDGHLDIMQGSFAPGRPPGSTDSTVVVLLGDGAGNFSTP